MPMFTKPLSPLPIKGRVQGEREKDAKRITALRELIPEKKVLAELKKGTETEDGAENKEEGAKNARTIRLNIIPFLIDIWLPDHMPLDEILIDFKALRPSRKEKEQFVSSAIITGLQISSLDAIIDHFLKMVKAKLSSGEIIELPDRINLLLNESGHLVLRKRTTLP